MSTHLKALAKRTSPEVISIFPLSGTVLLPGCELPLNIFEPRYLNMIDDALKTDRLIGMVQTNDQGLQSIGGLGRITQFSEADDGRYIILLKGLKRFKIIKEVQAATPYRQVQVSYQDYTLDPDVHDPSIMPESLTDIGGNERTALILAMKTFARTLGVNVDWEALAAVPLPSLVDQATMISPFKSHDKQSLLEAAGTHERRRLLIALMHLYSRPNSDDSKPN